MNGLSIDTQQAKRTPFTVTHLNSGANFGEGLGPLKWEQILARAIDAQVEQRLRARKRESRIDVRIDFENIHIGLKRIGRTSQPRVIIEAIKSAAKDLGEISRILAYADWAMLDKRNGHHIQRQLEELDLVETRYPINTKNKNSADMHIAGDIYNQLERDSFGPCTVDIFILVTGDRDFRRVVEKARERGKKVVILALKNSLSRLLSEAASEVRYLNDYLELPKTHQRYQRHQKAV